MIKLPSKVTKALWAVLAIALLAGTGYGVWYLKESDASAKTKELPAALLTKVKPRNIESRLLLSGEVAPAFSVDIKSEISGKVGAVHVRTGQHLRAGDPLLTIDDTDLLTEKAGAQTEIEGAKLEVNKRKGNYDRAKALFEEKLISKEVYANLESDLLIAGNNLIKAEAKMRTVEDKLSKTRILAPADGTVLNINVNQGQVVVGATSVNAGIILMSFADLSRLLIQTHVNQMDIANIKEGDELQIAMPGSDKKPVLAKVEFVAPVATIKNSIKGFAVEALIAERDPRLRPGMSVSMQLPLGKAEKALSVPVSAVFREDDGQRYVYVRKDGQTERRIVTVGISNFSFAEVLEGLEEGEEILLVQPKDLEKKG